jgi:hypothetical protein
LHEFVTGWLGPEHIWVRLRAALPLLQSLTRSSQVYREQRVYANATEDEIDIVIQQPQGASIIIEPKCESIGNQQSAFVAGVAKAYDKLAATTLAGSVRPCTAYAVAITVSGETAITMVSSTKTMDCFVGDFTHPIKEGDHGDTPWTGAGVWYWKKQFAYV